MPPVIVHTQQLGSIIFIIKSHKHPDEKGKAVFLRVMSIPRGITAHCIIYQTSLHMIIINRGIYIQ